MPEGTPAPPDPAAAPRLYQARKLRARRAQRLAGYGFGEAAIWRIDLGWLRLGGEQGLRATAGDRLAIPAGTRLDMELLPDAEAHEFRASLLRLDAGVARGFAAAAPQPAPLLLPSRPGLDLALAGLLDSAARSRSVTVRTGRQRLTALATALREAGVGRLVPVEADITERVRAVLRASPSRRWPADEVARALALSPATLRRRLAAAGTRFRTLHDELRLALAVDLLHDGDLTVQQIADACGYPAASRFAAAFRRRYGCAPSELRD